MPYHPPSGGTEWNHSVWLNQVVATVQRPIKRDATVGNRPCGCMLPLFELGVGARRFTDGIPGMAVYRDWVSHNCEIGSPCRFAAKGMTSLPV